MFKNYKFMKILIVFFLLFLLINFSFWYNQDIQTFNHNKIKNKYWNNSIEYKLNLFFKWDLLTAYYLKELLNTYINFKLINDQRKIKLFNKYSNAIYNYIQDYSLLDNDKIYKIYSNKYWIPVFKNWIENYSQIYRWPNWNY